MKFVNLLTTAAITFISSVSFTASFTADLADTFVGSFRNSNCPLFPASEFIRIERNNNKLELTSLGNSQTSPLEFYLQDIITPEGEIIKFSEGIYTFQNHHQDSNLNTTNIITLARSASGGRIRYASQNTVCVFYRQN